MQQRVVIITGASSGIGAAMARALADSSRLLLVARRQDRLESLATSIRDQGGTCVVHPADLADAAQIPGVIAAAVDAFGEIEVLINNAGVFPLAPQIAQSAADLEWVYAVNVRAPILLTSAALPHLRRSRGQVLNVSSIVTEHAFPGCGAYTASKMAVEGWSRCLREEEREHGVRVGVLVPGPTDTPVFDGKDFDRRRMMRPVDVALAVRQFLDMPPSASIERLTVMPPSGVQ